MSLPAYRRLHRLLRRCFHGRANRHLNWKALQTLLAR